MCLTPWMRCNLDHWNIFRIEFQARAERCASEARFSGSSEERGADFAISAKVFAGNDRYDVWLCSQKSTYSMAASGESGRYKTAGWVTIKECQDHIPCKVSMFNVESWLLAAACNCRSFCVAKTTACHQGLP